MGEQRRVSSVLEAEEVAQQQAGGRASLPPTHLSLLPFLLARAHWRLEGSQAAELAHLLRDDLRVGRQRETRGSCYGACHPQALLELIKKKKSYSVKL